MLDLTKFNLDWLNAERKATKESERHHQRDNVELQFYDFPEKADVRVESCALCERHRGDCEECVLEPCSQPGSPYMKMWDAWKDKDFPAFHDAAVEQVTTLKCKGELLDAEIAGREAPACHRHLLGQAGPRDELWILW